MMKKICFIILLAVIFTIPVYGAYNENLDRVVDNAGLLTDEEENQLRATISQITETHSYDVVILTIDESEGKTSVEYADDYYDYNEYGFGDSYDGMIFLLNMQDNEWYISTTGSGIAAFTDNDLDNIGNAVVDYLSEEKYFVAFDSFLYFVDTYLIFYNDTVNVEITEEMMTKVVDNAGLLTDEEEDKLRIKINDIVNRYNFDIVIVTTESCGNKTPVEYADDYFDYNDYGIGDNRDGMLFLLSMEERDWYISTHGYGIYAFTDYGLDRIGELVLNDLSGKYYYYAFSSFLDHAEMFLWNAEYDSPYDVNNEYLKSEPVDYTVTYLIIAAVVSIIFALIIVSVMKSGMNTIRVKQNAHDYIKKDSFVLLNKKDSFTYSNVTKIKIETSSSSGGGGSSTHRSSSGSSHGGRGGKF